MKKEVEFDPQESEYGPEEARERTDPTSAGKERGWLVFKVILIILTALSLLLLAEVSLFTVETVEVEGNTIYSDRVITDSLVRGDGSWNTLYVYLKYRFKQPEQMAFVDTIEVKMKGLHTLSVTVTEKELLGYIRLKEEKKNIYFDQDGYAGEISETKIDGVPKVTGLSLNSVEAYEKLPIDESLLSDLTRLTNLMKEYGLTPDAIRCKDTGELTISFGKTKVILGKAEGLEMKIKALQSIYPSIEGKTGSLDLSEYSETNTDIIFKKKY